jgi:catechol 2,3-dioxygenase-like lactoylglutathione lyase family enzyme
VSPSGPSLDGRRFRGAGGGVDVSAETVFTFAEDRDGVVTASYAGGAVVRGTLVGQRDGSVVSFSYSQLTSSGALSCGHSADRIELLDDGRLRLHESWEGDSGDGSGEFMLEELPGPRWVRGRVVRGCASPEASAEFYGGRLGFELDGPHVDLLLVALPGGGSLELSVYAPMPSSDLLVLYLASSADVTALVASAELSPVPSEDPYWSRYGVTLLDPDGHRIVLTAPPGL